jgi:hypothetical protein
MRPWWFFGWWRIVRRRRLEGWLPDSFRDLIEQPGNPFGSITWIGSQRRELWRRRRRYAGSSWVCVRFSPATGIFGQIPFRPPVAVASRHLVYSPSEWFCYLE